MNMYQPPTGSAWDNRLNYLKREVQPGEYIAIKHPAGKATVLCYVPHGPHQGYHAPNQQVVQLIREIEHVPGLQVYVISRTGTVAGVRPFYSRLNGWASMSAGLNSTIMWLMQHASYLQPVQEQDYILRHLHEYELRTGGYMRSASDFDMMQAALRDAGLSEPLSRVGNHVDTDAFRRDTAQKSPWEQPLTKYQMLMATLGEEAGEVSRMVGKCLRFGANDPCPPGYREAGMFNVAILRNEIMDLLATWEQLAIEHDRLGGIDMSLFTDDTIRPEVQDYIQQRMARFDKTLDISAKTGTYVGDGDRLDMDLSLGESDVVQCDASELSALANGTVIAIHMPGEIPQYKVYYIDNHRWQTGNNVTRILKAGNNNDVYVVRPTGAVSVTGNKMPWLHAMASHMFVCMPGHPSLSLPQVQAFLNTPHRNVSSNNNGQN